MTRNKDRKRIIRARMKKTGESFTTAASRLEAQGQGPALGEHAAVSVVLPLEQVREAVVVAQAPPRNLAEIRLSRQWVERVRTDGNWNAPPIWRPEDVVASPWGRELADTALAAVLRLYDRESTRRIFATTSPNCLWHLLGISWALHVSPLFRLGVDLLTAEAWAEKNLLERLRVASEYEGARLELAVYASLRRVGKLQPIGFRYEPLRNAGGSNPDFEIEPRGLGIYLDTKKTRESARTKEDWRYFLTLTQYAPHGVSVALTDRFDGLQRAADGRAWINDNLDRLGSLVDAAGRRLVAAGQFPAEQVIEDLILVRAPHRPGTAPHHGHQGTPRDEEHEAARVARGVVQNGAGQIPHDKPGVLLVDVGYYGDVRFVTHEIARWLQEEGAGYSNLVGVFVLGDIYHQGEFLDAFIPVWRNNAPPKIRDAQLWGQLANDMAWWNAALRRWRAAQ